MEVLENPPLTKKCVFTWQNKIKFGRKGGGNLGGKESEV